MRLCISYHSLCVDMLQIISISLKMAVNTYTVIFEEIQNGQLEAILLKKKSKIVIDVGYQIRYFYRTQKIFKSDFKQRHYDIKAKNKMAAMAAIFEIE